MLDKIDAPCTLLFSASLQRLLPPTTCGNPSRSTSRRDFWAQIYPKRDPHFQVEAVPKTIAENIGLKNYQFRVHKGWSLALPSENVRFRINLHKRGGLRAVVIEEFCPLILLFSLQQTPGITGKAGIGPKSGYVPEGKTIRSALLFIRILRSMAFLSRKKRGK